MSALSRLLGAPCVMALLAPAALPAVPLDLAFLPPAVEEQSLCGRAAAERRVDDGSPGTSGTAATGPFCRSCGVRNDEDARFCDGCGASLA